jgi:hypothetical protein
MSVRVPNWRELSESTGLAVLTFPDGQTLSTHTIVASRINEQHEGYISPRHVQITCARGPSMTASVAVYDEVDAVAELVREAHRRAGLPVVGGGL